MSKAIRKQLGFYFCMIQMGICLTSCESIPLLKQDKYAPSKLENPKKARQLPQKIDNVTSREQVIYTFLADAEQALNKQAFDEAARLYQDLATYDPGNIQAQQGLQYIEMEQQHLNVLAEAEAIMSGAGDDKQLEHLALAIEKLHPVLLESPQHPRVLPYYQQLLAKQATLKQQKAIKKLAFNQPVTMEFRDANLKMIFESLSKTTKINFILDKDIPSDQKATIFVKSVAFNDALDLLLQTNQLEKKVLSDNSVIIYVNDPMRQREYKDLSVRSFTLDYADAKQITAILRSMLNIKNIETDTRLNTILIKDSPETLQIAEKIIYAQDKPDPEVMLEMQVMEVKRSYLQNLGVQTPTGLTVPVPSGGVLTVRDLRDVTGNALVVNGVPGLVFNTTNGDANLLANPRIRVKNKDVAKIHIGEKVPVFTSNVASTGVSSETIQYIDAGLKLEVEPSISSTEDVTIKLNLNVGSIGETVTSSAGGKAFRVGTRLTSTQLRLHDGETQVLAGLIDDQDRKNISGIPGLANLPLLGRLFSAHTDDQSKTEIVLSITPHIIRSRTPQLAHEAEVWIGPEGRTGKTSPSPSFQKGASPFIVPKPAPAAAKPASAVDAPSNLNIPLPSGFSLGGGLNPLAAPGKTE